MAIIWLKRHKLISLSLVYFGFAILIGIIGEVCGFNGYGITRTFGIFYWLFLFLCWTSLKVSKDKQKG